MDNRIHLHVWGDYACFTRPEFKVERVSYDVMTPSAARGILEAIYWKPGIRWVIDRIHLLKPIRFESIRRNELKTGKRSPRKLNTAMREANLDALPLGIEELRTQRASLILRDVAYVVEAHLELSTVVQAPHLIAEHIDRMKRRARRGQCFHSPYLGNREFPAAFAWVDPTQDLSAPVKPASLLGVKDLGWMLQDMDFVNHAQPIFFRATLTDGIMDVPNIPVTPSERGTL